MSHEILGARFDHLQYPIRAALHGYEQLGNGGWEFQLNQAAQLELTPAKPNSARSQTEARYEGEVVGDLFVIAFKPGDGTGAESDTRKLSDLSVEKPFPHAERVVPRNKTGVHGEAHMNLVSLRLGDVHADPELYLGTYDLLGLDESGKKIVQIGEIGNPRRITTKDLVPRTTLTVGYNEQGERFGDPHAVYSSKPHTLQICAFLAISDAVHEQYPDALASLNPQLPRPV